MSDDNDDDMLDAVRKSCIHHKQSISKKQCLVVGEMVDIDDNNNNDDDDDDDNNDDDDDDNNNDDDDDNDDDVVPMHLSA